jgi:hypothetical protein
MLEALTAPEPRFTLEPLLVTTASASAVSVAVVLLMAPLVSNSMFPEVVRRFELIAMGEVLEVDPMTIELGFVPALNPPPDPKANSYVVAVPEFSSVVPTGRKTRGPSTASSNSISFKMRSASTTRPPLTVMIVLPVPNPSPW